MSNTVINTNSAAMTSLRNLKSVGNDQARSNNRLSSGKKINNAADDAAGLAISQKMKAQIRGLDMAAKNGEDGISLIQTAEGSISEIANMVQRIRELTVQAANDTNTTNDRDKIKTEVTQLIEEIDAMSGRTEFNKIELISSSGAFSGSFQIGANSSQAISLTLDSMDAASLKVDDADDQLSSYGVATANLDVLDSALETIATQRSYLGAKQNRLEYTVNNLNVSSENLSAANSRIEDADMGKEMMTLSSKNVLQQAATAMLAQANQRPQNVLQLLG